MEDIPDSPGVYKITNISNNKIYVGSSNILYRRRYEHFFKLNKDEHYNLYLQRSYNKYGKESFIFEILELCDAGVLLQREDYYIKLLKSNDPKYGYNLEGVSSTCLGRKLSLESREKIKIARSKQIISKETRAKMVESRLKKSGFNSVSELFRDMAFKVGKTPKELWKKRDFSPYRTKEHREKMGKFLKQIALEKAKPFICLENNKVYKLSSEAAEDLNIGYKLIWRVLKGERKHTHGYHFKYIEDENKT